MAPLVLDLDTTGNILGDVIEKILDSNIDHLVLPFDALYLKDLIETLAEEMPDLKIYGTLHFSMGIESREDNWDSYEGIYMVSPHLDRNKYSALHYSQSAYMYDAVNLVINAIQQVGCEREAITDYISKSDYSKGITGSISFDELGNRQGASTLIRIQNGVPHLIDSLNQ